VVSGHRPAPEVAVLGAPSSIGLRPDDRSGGPQRVDQAPTTLRVLGLVARLAATDLGDVLPPPYEDFERPPGKARNEAGVATYSRSLADAVAAKIDDDRFLVVIGGDCSIVLGCLLGAGRARRGMGSDPGRIGLVYVDGHADFANPEESMTGSVASMGLALAVGRGDTQLARLAGLVPLVRGQDVALIGRRDQGQWYGHEALAVSGILDVPWAAIAPDGTAVRPNALAETASTVLDRVAASDVSGFWIHVDADVLNPEVLPAVGSPEPGGPDIDELAVLLAPLVDHPKALGIALALYDPSLDPDRSSAARLVELLAQSLLSGGRHAAPA
jgi:arginase